MFSTEVYCKLARAGYSEQRINSILISMCYADGVKFNDDTVKHFLGDDILK